MARDAPPLASTVVASAARTASGSSGPLSGFASAESLRAQLDVSAASGVTPTLDVVIEDTLDGVNWNVVATFTQKTAVSRQVVDVTTPFSDQIRVRWTAGGTTPSFTFSVAVYAQ